MASDGAALENDIATALSLLLERHRAAKAAYGRARRRPDHPRRARRAQPVVRLLPRDARRGLRHPAARPAPRLRRRGSRRRRLCWERRHPSRLLPCCLRRARSRPARGRGGDQPRRPEHRALLQRRRLGHGVCPRRRRREHRAGRRSPAPSTPCSASTASAPVPGPASTSTTSARASPCGAARRSRRHGSWARSRPRWSRGRLTAARARRREPPWPPHRSSRRRMAERFPTKRKRRQKKKAR